MQEIVESGELGKLRAVEASFCFPLPMFSDIRYNFDLGGGALMDAGCYAVHMVRLLGLLGGAQAGGEPDVVRATAKLRGTNIDRAMRADRRFSAGHTGRILCSMWSSDLLKISAHAVGDRGKLSVFNPLMGHRISVRTKDGKRTEHVSKRATYAYQLDAFAAAVLHGAPVLTPPADSIANMTVIDSIYTAAGLPLRQPAPIS